MATVSGVLPAMRSRGRGQVALVSSLSAWYGLPLTPSYCASKAGLKAYGEALRGWLAAEGVAVNVVLPGFVTSEMSASFPGPQPMLLHPEQAARRIARGLALNRARISFPFPLNFGMWWLAVLPAGLSQQILRWLGYGR
jgi:short-subunit dehydrogenase